MRTGLVVLLILALAPAAADAKKRSPKKASCPAGQLPVMAGKGKKAKPARDRRGRLRCARPARPAAGALPRAAAPTPAAQLAVVADELESALTVHPDALRPVARRIGAGRTAKLLAIALDSWRTRAVVARARPRAHAAETRSDTYTPVKGGEVKFSGSFDTVDTAKANGFAGKATVEGDFDRGALDELARKADVTLPDDVKGGRFKLELEFSDLPAPCPDASGKVKGSLKAGGRITLSAGGASLTLAARIDAGYALQVGEDARWHTIDDVDVKTELSAGGTGRSTETWRGRRVGRGFGTEGIFDKGADFKEAFGRDWGHIDPDQGGVWGPKGGVNLATGKGNLLDLHSIDHFKKMLATNVATQLITLAVVEYVRQVAADRVQKVWYDGEACLKLDVSAAKAKLKPNETTPVTARNARAADGGPVAANLTASGAQKIDPGSAALPAGAAKDFTLTAPGSAPVKASYKIVALSRAGKKTVSGDIGGEQGPYTVTLDDIETASFATHDSSAKLGGSLTLKAVDGSAPQRWTDLAPVTWSDITVTSKIECAFVDPVSAGTWSATITDVGNDRIRVDLDFSSATAVLFTVMCPESPPIHGEPGPRPVGLAPLSFELPAGGGVQALGGSVADGGDGFFTNGTLTVTPAPA
jgi:hypothetical protein